MRLWDDLLDCLHRELPRSERGLPTQCVLRIIKGQRRCSVSHGLSAFDNCDDHHQEAAHDGRTEPSRNASDNDRRTNNEEQAEETRTDEFGKAGNGPTTGHIRPYPGSDHIGKELSPIAG